MSYLGKSFGLGCYVLVMVKVPRTHITIRQTTMFHPTLFSKQTVTTSLEVIGRRSVLSDDSLYLGT